MGIEDAIDLVEDLLDDAWQTIEALADAQRGAEQIQVSYVIAELCRASAALKAARNLDRVR